MFEEEAMVEEDLRHNSQVFSEIFFINISVEIVDKKEVTIRCLL